jgi:hypothetical protein
MEHQDFLDNARKIVEEGQQRGVLLRLLGAVAFYLHCPKYGSMQQQANRHFTDLDFAAYFKHNEGIRTLFAALGFQEDREVAVVYARQRLVFDHLDLPLHIDIFFDKLDFCHPIPWAGRLEKDSPTIPLAELLLEKMQIIQLNEKDVIDTLMLLREHPLGDDDHDTINSARIASLLSKDWGTWRTITMNLSKVSELAEHYAWLDKESCGVIRQRVTDLLGVINTAPKTPAWKVRSTVGDRVKWYKEVHEISQ